MGHRRTSSRARAMVGLIALTLVAALTLAPAATVFAAEPDDTVLAWNLNAVNALSNPTVPVVEGAAPGAGQTPPASAIHLAMVQGAVYDAVNAIDGDHEPYLDGLPRLRRRPRRPPPPRRRPTMSSSASCRRCRRSSRTVSTPARRHARRHPAGRPRPMGSRSAPRPRPRCSPPAPTTAASAATPGRPAPSRASGGSCRPRMRACSPWAGKVTPFTLKRTGQFRTEGPLDLASAEYAAEFNEVKAKGAQTGSTRTEAETAPRALRHSQSAAVHESRPPRHRGGTRSVDRANQALLLAKTNMAAADALINCWDDKDHWSFWRPQTAIREAANDGNPATSPQADWLSFFPTPGYPDHPSGYNCYTGAMMHSARLLLRHRQGRFDLTSPGQRRHDPPLRPLHGRDPRHDRRAHPHRVPLPDARRPGRLDRQEGRPVGRPALLRAPSTDGRGNRKRGVAFGGAASHVRVVSLSAARVVQLGGCRYPEPGCRPRRAPCHRAAAWPCGRWRRRPCSRLRSRSRGPDRTARRMPGSRARWRCWR